MTNDERIEKLKGAVSTLDEMIVLEKRVLELHGQLRNELQRQLNVALRERGGK